MKAVFVRCKEKQYNMLASKGNIKNAFKGDARIYFHLGK